VMNMVALLAIPLIIRYENSPWAFWISIGAALFLLVLILKDVKTSQAEAGILRKSSV